MKLNTYFKPTLAAGILAVLSWAAPVQADDSKTTAASSEDSKQSSDNSNQGGDSSNQGGEDSKNGSTSLSGGVAAPVQSSADPYGLKIAGPVMQAGSDAASQSFQKSVLPGLTDFIHKALPEWANNTKSTAFQIDPSKLVLATKTAVRAYFVSEGAAYHNSIGVNMTTPGNDPKSTYAEVTSASSKLIFPDASSTASTMNDGSGKSGTRTANEPVLAGDFVNLGTFAGGTKLDFFLLSNGARQSSASAFSTTESINPDGFQQHVAAFTTKLFAVPQLNSPYIFLSFEDLYGGGDKDINDTIIALDVGKATVKALLATPEPAMWLTGGSFLLLAVWAKRRMDRQSLVAVRN